MFSDTQSIMEAIRRSLPEMDISAGLDFCCNDEDFFITILQDYIGADRVKNLCEMYGASDWSLYRIAAHSTKSTSKTVGLTSLSDRFLGLETAAKESDIGYIHANHAAAVSELERVMNILKSIVPPSEE